MTFCRLLPIQYADYSIWQRKWLEGEILEKQLDYWKKQLSGKPKILSPSPIIQDLQSSVLMVRKYHLRYDKGLTNKLDFLSREIGITLFITLLSAFQILLRRYSGQDDILVGTPVANRNRFEIENLIGFFVNTLVMKGNFSEKQTVREFLKRPRTNVLEAYMHQDLPFELLVEALNSDRDLKSLPYFSSCFYITNVTS